MPVNALEIHTVRQVDCRSDVQVFEYRETGVDRQRVTDTCLPVTQEVRMYKLALLYAVYADTAVHGVAQADFLIPLFFAAYFPFFLQHSRP